MEREGVLTKAKDVALLNDSRVGRRICHYTNAWLQALWAYSIVSRTFLAWLPGHPVKRISKAQPSTSLLEQYVLDMLGKDSIEPVPSELIIR